MTREELEQLSELLIKYYEYTDNGQLRTEISTVRHYVDEDVHLFGTSEVPSE